MTKAEKKKYNDLCIIAWSLCREAMTRGFVTHYERLRTCNAHVEYYCGYVVLVSYSTPVAFIDDKGRLFDVLRLVYGYTATSAQHIAKFKKDFRNYWDSTYCYKE